MRVGWLGDRHEAEWIEALERYGVEAIDAPRHANVSSRWDVVIAWGRAARRQARAWAHEGRVGRIIAPVSASRWGEERPEGVETRQDDPPQWVVDHPWCLARWVGESLSRRGRPWLIAGPPASARCTGGPSEPSLAARPGLTLPPPHARVVVVALDTPALSRAGDQGRGRDRWRTAVMSPEAVLTRLFKRLVALDRPGELRLAVLGAGVLARRLREEIAGIPGVLVESVEEAGNLGPSDWNDSLRRCDLALVVRPRSPERGRAILEATRVLAPRVAWLDETDHLIDRMTQAGAVGWTQALNVAAVSEVDRRLAVRCLGADNRAALLLERLEQARERYESSRRGRLRVVFKDHLPPPAFMPLDLPSQRPEGRSRVRVVALREGRGFVSWAIHPEDRAAAQSWLGMDLIRAVLVLRLYDVEGIEFHGRDAHRVVDIELDPGRDHQAFLFPDLGRSYAAALGYRTDRAVFHVLAHGPIVRSAGGEGRVDHAGLRRIHVAPRAVLTVGSGRRVVEEGA
ncbi:hypothetical protein Isop_2463 [Isosphaera pallida ATCC 43644]|uniref:Uncharacterized protein n=1 Tax=Isosphaera pallida (strain ATCC 43644 / DSM 9630 / IS1B) TaxID=575540 RepID=E8QXI8_ISOPI|nr:DUF4912 domain-containing protein [Isosphaera pallida]ADV63036.1 hypothetical protein Isop_2463 [Isosphaera pallida ATCC 43644]